MVRTFSPLIATLVAIGILFFYVRPQYAEIRVIQDDVREFEEAVDKATEFNVLLAALITKRNDLTGVEVDRLERLIPDNIDTVKLLVDLEGLAKRHGMLFGNINADEATEPDVVSDREASSDNSRRTSVSEIDFQKVTVTFSLIGTYDQFREMLLDMERSLTVFEISAINFDSSEGDLMQYDLAIDLFALKPSS